MQRSFQLACAISLSSAVNVELFTGYEKPGLPGTVFSVTEDDFNRNDNFCTTLTQLSLVKLPGTQSASCKLYNSLGQYVQGVKELQEGDKLHRIGDEHWFVWPPVTVGHNVTIRDLNSEPVIMETLAIAPRVFRLHGFLSHGEVDQLVNTAKALSMTRSTGGLQKVDSKDPNNKGDYTSHRTSTNSWDQSSPLATKLKRRAFQLLRIPYREALADGLQVVRYEPGQFYHSHHDFFQPGATQDGWNFDSAIGGSNRIATVFLYLSDHDAGGETVFPHLPTTEIESEESKRNIASLRASVLVPGGIEDKMVDVCRSRFHVKPAKGDAILFYHQDTLGRLDDSALHGACPVLRGEKWGANLWVWNGPVYQPGGEMKDDGLHKRASKDAVMITLTNQGSKSAVVYAIDGRGREEITKIGPKESFHLHIFLGQFLVVENEEGKVYGKFKVTIANQSFVFPKIKKKEEGGKDEL